MFDQESVNIANSVIVWDPSANSGNGDYMSLSCSTGDNQLFTNQATLLFSEDGTAGLDETDARKLSPEGLATRWISFHSLDENNKSYTLQSLPMDFGEQVRIPLDIRTTESGWFPLDWTLPESHLFNGSYIFEGQHKRRSY